MEEKPKRKKKDHYTPYERRRYMARWKYGIPFEEFDALMEEEQCRICSTGPPLVIDHCHSTGKIRGVLCNDCNLGLGRFKDSPELLLLAVEYLKTHTEKPPNSGV